jgi:hypothetical protein
MRKRERRLRQPANSNVKEAMQKLGERDQVFKTAQSLDEIERARDKHRASAPILKAFENSKARQKELRHQRLRTERAWTKLGSAERTFVKTRAMDMEKMMEELGQGEGKGQHKDMDSGKDTGQEAQQGNTPMVDICGHLRCVTRL